MMTIAPLLLSVAFNLCQAEVRSADDDPSHAERCAREEAVRAMSLFPGRMQHIVIAHIDGDRVNPGENAHTERSSIFSNTCTLVFRNAAVASRSRTIAHEVCHCAYDFDVIDGSHYDTRRVSAQEVADRENNAQSCSDLVLMQMEDPDFDLHPTRRLALPPLVLRANNFKKETPSTWR